jgi:hypothetical protein
VMRHIRIRRCPHVDNSDDVHVAISAGTNRPDRVDVFALLYLSLHMSSRSIVGDGGRRKERSTLGLANAIAAGELLEEGRESEVVVDSGQRTAPRGNRLEHIEDGTSGAIRS